MKKTLTLFTMIVLCVGTMAQTQIILNFTCRTAFVGIASAEERRFQGLSEEITLGFNVPLPVPGDAVPCPGTPTVTDYDGNVYNTVQIGNQCWKKENLRTTHYANGNPVPAGTTSSYTSPYYYNDSYSTIPLAQRGYLYNWPAVMHGAASSNTNPSGVQGICPNGWHVPCKAEFENLRNYLKLNDNSHYWCDNTLVYIAKALASTTRWENSTVPCSVGNNQSSNNATGFSAIPVGSWTNNFGYAAEGESASFYSTTAEGENDAYRMALQYNAPPVYITYFPKNDASSVRCLKN